MTKKEASRVLDMKDRLGLKEAEIVKLNDTISKLMTRNQEQCAINHYDCMMKNVNHKNNLIGVLKALRFSETDPIRQGFIEDSIRKANA